MTPEEYNDLYSESFNKQMRIVVEDTDVVITNPNICSETMSINESLNSDVNLKFGSCESSCFQIRVANIESSLKGKWLDVNMDVAARILPEKWITENGEYVVDETDDELMFGEMIDAHSISLGRYKVKDDVPTNDRCWRDLTCFDVMYDILNADVSGWFESLTFPMTIKNFRDSFFTYLGIEQVETTLINDSFVTQGGFVVDGQLAGKTVINAICELNGCFGHITTDGKFDYVYIPNGDSVTLNWYIDGSGSYEDYTVQKITGIIARADDEDVGTTVGTTVNPYIIENNPLIYGSEDNDLTDALTNILNAIKDITYRPFKVRTYGNPMLNLGAAITINTRNKTINSIVINKFMKGIQALTDEFSAEGDEYVPSKVNDVQSQIQRTKGRVHKLQIDLNTFKSEMEDVTEDVYSLIEQTQNHIVLEVDNQGRIVKVELSGEPATGTVFTVSADNLNLSASDIITLMAGGTLTLGGQNGVIISGTNFSVDANGNVTLTGTITATAGQIGGWTIGANKIYAGDGTANNEVAVMQKPASNINWVFAAGGDSHSSYASCPFKVSKNGSLFTKYININDGTSNQTSTSCAYLGWDEQDDCINVLFRNSNGSNVLGINGDTGSISASGNIVSVNGTISSFGSMQVGDNTANSSRGYLIQTNGGGIASFGLDTNGECGITRLAGTTVNYIVYRLSSGNVRLGDGGGYVDTSGVWHNGSSIKIKKNIESITDEEALKVLDLRPVKFDFKQSETDNQNESGFIAEEVEKIYPKIVGEESGTEGESDYLPKSLKYTDFIPYIVKLLQIQQEEIKMLKAKLGLEDKK